MLDLLRPKYSQTYEQIYRMAKIHEEIKNNFVTRCDGIMKHVLHAFGSISKTKKFRVIRLIQHVETSQRHFHGLKRNRWDNVRDNVVVGPTLGASQSVRYAP